MTVSDQFVRVMWEVEPPRYIKTSSANRKRLFFSISIDFSVFVPVQNVSEQAKQISWWRLKRVRSSRKFHELIKAGCLAVSLRWTVTKLKWPKPRLEASAVAALSQIVVKAFAGVTRAGSREPVHVKLAWAFGKSADSLGGANECRALLTVLYPGSGRSLAASCPSCPCEMWKINRLEGADGSKHTRTHLTEYTTLAEHTRADAHRLRETEIHARSASLRRHTPTLGRKHTRAWLTALSHHEGSSQAKPWGLSRDDSKLPAGPPLRQPGGAPHQNDSRTATLLRSR